MGTRVTVKGQVTLPKSVREAAGIRPGDVVSVRVRPEGGVVVEREADARAQNDYRRKLQAMARRRRFKGFTTEDVMRLTRGED